MGGKSSVTSEYDIPIEKPFYLISNILFFMTIHHHHSRKTLTSYRLTDTLTGEQIMYYYAAPLQTAEGGKDQFKRMIYNTS